MAEHRLEPVPQQVEEAFLADPAALELEQRMPAAEARLAGGHRDPELLERDPVVVLKGGEGAEKGGGQDPAEIADDGADRHGGAFCPMGEVAVRSDVTE